MKPAPKPEATPGKANENGEEEEETTEEETTEETVEETESGETEETEEEESETEETEQEADIIEPQDTVRIEFPVEAVPKGPTPVFKTSGMPRYLEGARYWLQCSRSA